MAGLLLVSGSLVSGCKDDDDDSQPATVDVAATKKAAVTTYAAIAYAQYSDALSTAQTLDTKARAFVAAPTAAGFADLKNAWLAARVPYGQTEAMRFYADSPIEEYEGEMNSWPMDEQFVDYTIDPTSGAVVQTGIINNPAMYPTIDAALIESLNQNPTEEDVATGYHAIEFLLWGQDRSVTGPGDRPYTDYVTGPGGTAQNQARRGQYLTTCTGLLVTQLQAIASAWAPSATNYRAQFEALPVDSALERIFLGLGSLSDGELASERIEPAYVEKMQEQEHSCFSDNTDEDIRLNQLGIENILLGRYRRPDGTEVKGGSLLDAVRAANAGRADAQATATALASTTTAAIEHPFDQEFLGADTAPGRVRLKAAIDALRAQAARLVESADALGVHLNL